MSCNYNFDCLKCEAPDCTYNGILPSERKEIRERDKSLTSYGSVIKARPSKGNKKRKYYS